MRPSSRWLRCQAPCGAAARAANAARKKNRAKARLRRIWYLLVLDGTPAQGVPLEGLERKPLLHFVLGQLADEIGVHTHRRHAHEILDGKVRIAGVVERF